MLRLLQEDLKHPRMLGLGAISCTQVVMMCQVLSAVSHKMFPWSRHVDWVTMLIKKSGAAIFNTLSGSWLLQILFRSASGFPPCTLPIRKICTGNACSCYARHGANCYDTCMKCTIRLLVSLPRFAISVPKPTYVQACSAAVFPSCYHLAAATSQEHRPLERPFTSQSSGLRRMMVGWNWGGVVKLRPVLESNLLRCIGTIFCRGATTL